MGIIEIPFNGWSTKQIKAHLKKATSRYKKYGNVGDTFEVNGWKYELELVIKLPLWFVIEDLYESEGADNSDELKEEWIKIHPGKRYRPFDEVWYHHFKEI